MTYQVFTISGSPRSWRVLLALAIKNVPFVNHVLSVSKAEHKTPAFAALNPRQRVPVLEDDGFVLPESIAILAYLDQKHPAPPLIGKNPQEAARSWRIAMEGDHDLRDAGFAFLRPFLLKQAVDADDPAFIEAATRMHAEHARVESWLADSSWLAGERISIADVVCFPEVQLLLRAIQLNPQAMSAAGFGNYSGSYPKVASWVKRIEAIPGYELTYPPHWRE